MMRTNSYTNHQQRVHHLSGRELGYELRGKTAAQRAVLAAQYCADDHTVVVYDLTEKQLAALFRISVPTFDTAKALDQSERATGFPGLSPVVSPTRRLERDIAAVGIDRAFSALERVMDGKGANGQAMSAS